MSLHDLLQVGRGFGAVPIARFANIDQLMLDPANNERVNTDIPRDDGAIDQFIKIFSDKSMRLISHWF